MMNNYNSLSSGTSAWLKNEVGEFTGSPPTNSHKVRRTSWLLNLFIAVLFMAGGSVWSQGLANAYTFAEGTETYTQVVGTNSTATGDDGIQGPTSIGFSFVFDQTTYTQFSVNANGLIKFGAVTIGGSAWTNSIANAATHRPFVAALWDDNHRNTGSIQYLVSGTAPNRTLEIGFHNVNIGGGGSISGTNLASYKVRLYETTNVIEFVYGPTLATAGTLSASVGINGSTSFLSVTPAATSTVSSTTANNAIAATTNLVGKKYTFTPPVVSTPPACIALPTAPANAATGIIPTTLTWPVAAGGASGYTLSFGSDVGATNIVNGVALGNVTSYTILASLSPSTVYYWKIAPSNAFGTQTGCVTWSFTTATVPNCATALVPAAAATNVVRNPTLSWTAPSSPAASSYDIYLGTSPSPAFVVNQAGTSYVPVLLAASTQYYWKIVPKNSLGAAIGCIESTFTTGTNIVYCTPVTSSGCTDGDVIARVILNTLDNNSGTGCPSGLAGYSDYTANPALTTTLQAGTSYGCTVFAGEYAEGYAAWIDYNDNGVFETTERIGFSAGQVAGSGAVGVLGSSATFPIALACNPPLGTHRLRVRAMFATNGNLVTPCGNNSFGEVEDYLVTISAADPCPQPSALAAANITSSSADLSWTLGCAETVWEVAVQAAGSGVPTSGVTSATTTYSATSLSLGTAYEFYVRAECSAGVLYSAWSGPFAFTTVDNLPACTTLVSPADGATGVAIVGGAAQLTWNAPATSPTEGLATSYNVFFGTTSGALTLIGTLPAPVSGNPTVGITGLTYNQTNFWRIVPVSSGGAAVGPCPEWSFTTESLPANDVCTGATNLDVLTSPISGATSGYSDNFAPTCGFSGAIGPDVFYSITVPNGYTLAIRNTASSFDSANSLFYGSCTTQTLVACTDPELVTLTFTNSTGTTQTAFWVQDSWNTTPGTFTLAWTLTPPPVVVTSFAPTAVCGQAGGTVMTITGSNFTGATDVQFNGISAGAGNYTVNSDTQITATLPAGNTVGTVVVYNVPSSNGSGVSATTLTVNAFPLVDPIVGPTEVCVPDTISLTNNTGLGVWSSSNGLVATVDSAGFVTGVAVGSVTISYTVTQDGCPTVQTYVVAVSEPVVITAQPTNQVVVTGNNATYSVTATGTGLTYQWEQSTDFGGSWSPLSDDATFSGSLTSSLLITATPETLNDTDYRCVISGTSPCAPLESGSASLAVGNTGIATNPSNVSLCDGGTAMFTVVASGGVDGYTWYENRGLNFDPIVAGTFGAYTYAIDNSVPNTSTLTVSGLTTTSNGWAYYANVDGPANDPNSSAASLAVNTGVGISSQPTSTSVCRAIGNANFSVTPTGTFGTIQWQVSSNGTTGWTNAGTGSSLSVAITGATPVGVTYYRATVNATAPCLALDSDVVTLTVTQPTISVTPSAASYCTPGSAVSLTASGASTYVWSPATGLSATTGDTVLASPSATTVYTVTGTDSSGCVNSQTVTITTGPAIAATVSATPAVFCAGSTSQLNAVTPVVTVTIPNYTFSASAGTYTPLVGGINSTATGDDGTQSAVPIGFTFSYGGTNFTSFGLSTNGNMRLGGAAAGFTNSISGTANILAPLWDDNHRTSGSISYRTTGTTPNRVLTVQWANVAIGGGGSTANPTNNYQVQLFEGTNVVQYNYGTLTAANSITASIGISGGLASQYKSITPLSPVSTSTSSSTVTNNALSSVANIPTGTSYTFTPPIIPVYTYAWSPATDLSSTTIANPVASNVNASITYTVVVTNNFGCNATYTQVLTVESGAAIATQPVALSQCAGTSASFTVSATGPGLTYQWRKNGTPIVGNASAATATLALTAIVEADEASYDVVITPLCGDLATSDAVALTVNDIPTAVATNNGPVCEGSTLNLFGGTTNGVTFAWTGPNGFTSASQNPSISNVTSAAAGVYTFLATSVDTCSFSGTTTVVINTNQAIVLTTSGASGTGCVGEIKTLTAQSFEPASVIVPFGINLSSNGSVTATYPATITGIPAGATITSAQLQFTNVNAIGGSFRSEIRVALSGAHTLAATQISTVSSGGLISPDPTVNVTGFTATSGVVNLLLTETFNDGGTAVDATFGSAQLVINYLKQTNITWSPTTDLYTDVNATVPYTGTAASTVYAKVTSPATYTATSTTVLGCTRTAQTSYTITTVGCPSTTAVQGPQCGQTLAQIDSYVYADIVAGAQGYRFRVTDLTTNQVQTIDRSLRVFRMTQLVSYAFNRAYQVEVSVRLAGVWQPFFGTPCTVTTPATTTQLTNCPAQTLTSLTNVIYANDVPFSTGYRFTVTNASNPLDTQTITRNLREFRMNLLTGIQYNTTYNVSVEVRNTDGVTFLPAGSVCDVTTPSFPATFLQDPQCDDYVVPTNATVIYAVPVTGATGYRFRLVNSTLGYSQEQDRVLRSFSLSNFTGLTPGTTYLVRVAVQIGGVWGSFTGKDCTVIVPGLARDITEDTLSKVNFEAIAYPNPFASNFLINVKTSSQEVVSVKVYDMVGRLIEQRQSKATEMENATIGERYPSGVYNVVVTQGLLTETLRVIKR